MKPGALSELFSFLYSLCKERRTGATKIFADQGNSAPEVQDLLSAIVIAVLYIHSVRDWEVLRFYFNILTWKDTLDARSITQEKPERVIQSLEHTYTEHTWTLVSEMVGVVNIQLGGRSISWRVYRCPTMTALSRTHRSTFLLTYSICKIILRVAN